MLKIYVDMDSVITDFDKQLADLLGRKLDRNWDFGSDPKIWKKITEAGVSFWADMPYMPDGEKLWNALKRYKPIILSAPTRDYSSVQGKKKWMSKNIPNAPYIIERHKDKYAEPNAVLIDDRIKNIRKWEDAGGIGILHKKVDSTLKKLRDIVSKHKKSKEGNEMENLIERIDKIAQGLEDKGFFNDALALDKISDILDKYAQTYTMEDLMRSPLMTGIKKREEIKERPSGIREFFVESRFGPVKLVKSVLRNLRDPKATRIYSFIEDAEKIKINNEAAVEAIKKKIREASLDFSMDMAEFISLFLKLVEEGPGHHDFANDKRLLYSLAPKISPKREMKRDLLKSDFPGSSSRMFYEMARRASEIDISGLSDDHLRIASECLVNIIGALNSKMTKNNFFTFDGRNWIIGHDATDNSTWTRHSNDGLNWGTIIAESISKSHS